MAETLCHHISMHLRGILLCAATLLTATALFHAADNAKLPPPYATLPANSRPRVIPQPSGAKLNVPAGFYSNVYMDGVKLPRYMLLRICDGILITDAGRGTVGGVYVLEGNQEKAIIDGLDRIF